MSGQSRSNVFNILIFVVLVVTIAALGFFVLQLQQQQDRLDTLNQQLSQQQATQQEFSDQSKAVEQVATQALAQSQKNLASEAELSAEKTEYWQLSEAHYLLRLAEQHLMLTRDAQGAMALVLAVDKILASIDMNQVISVRAELSEQKKALAVAAQLDLDGVYLRLMTIMNAVTQLSERPSFVVSSEVTVIGEPADVSIWQRIISLFQRVFVVTKNDGRIKPLLQEEQQILFEQQIMLYLQQAQMAVLQQRPGVYQSSLQAIELMLSEQTQLNMNQKRWMVSELSALKAVELQPELPQLSKSLTMLRAIIDVEAQQ